MSKALVLISHGHFCEELKKSTEMIMGPQENIYTVPLLPEDGQESYKKKFLKVVEPLDDYIVLADLMGGTPCNVVSKLIMTGSKIDLYAGMNLPMVIGFINGALIDQPVDLVKEGQKNIHHVNDLLSAALDDDDDE